CALPISILHGTALGAQQLNASSGVAGSFEYSPAAGTVLDAGTHTLSVTFTPSSSNYAASTATVSIVVGKATPTITWNTPSRITYGTALSGSQLNASANVAGSFAYSPTAGTVLDAGPQTLTATFTSTDPNYNDGAASVSLSVAPASTSITWADPSGI